MLVLIHGYGGSPAELEPLRRQLGGRIEVSMPTLLAHGGRPLPEVTGFDGLFNDLVSQLEPDTGAPVFILGYSLGGYCALLLARRYPAWVRGVIAIATQHRIGEKALAHMRGLLTPERMFGAAGERKEDLNRRLGATLTEERLARAMALYQRLHDDPPLTDEDLRAIAAPALVISGEQDPLASGADTRDLAGLLPAARVAMIPGRAHPIRNLPVAPVAREVLRYLNDVEGGGFDPGPPVDLGETLVSGGLAQPGVAVSIGKAGD